MKYISKNEEKTRNIARQLAPKLQKGDIICLQGNLGAGKSVFARALIRTLCNNPALEVPSPTFTLVQNYDMASVPVWHFDLYRIEDPEEIYELGWEDALAEGITIIEWPERLESLAPSDCLTLVFETRDNDENHREITVLAEANWKNRL